MSEPDTRPLPERVLKPEIDIDWRLRGDRAPEPDQESQSNDKQHKRDRALSDHLQREADMLPLQSGVLKKLVVGGSCCASVVGLSILASYDHNWIPGIDSSFAQASEMRKVQSEYASMKQDVTDMYNLNLARAIRDVWIDRCMAKDSVAQRVKDDQLETLQVTYQARNGRRYFLLSCKDL